MGNNIDTQRTRQGHSSNPVAILVPPVVCHNLDPHTGIPFMPHMAAYLAGALVQGGREIEVIDCFGLQPNMRQIIGEFMLMGVTEEWVNLHISTDIMVCYIYCRTIAEFIAVERLIQTLKKRRPHLKLCLFENIQAVTSYSLRHVAAEFLDHGIDCIIMGEPEDRVLEVTYRLENGLKLDGIEGIAYRDQNQIHIRSDSKLSDKLDDLPLPAWDKFPLQGYWSAGFAHAPCARGQRFLPILTSRGCPYKCTFCIAPELNSLWRSRSASNVVDEMEHFYKTLGVVDFHVSDLNPTVSEKRTKEICREIIMRNLPVTWKLAQGTKIETIKKEETLELMATAGCKFVSFSPESGSQRLLKIMNKPFNFEHGLKMARKMSLLGIKMQAVFLGGVPGENAVDRKLSADYAKKLIKAGVDEISLVIFTPLPGAKLSKAINDFTHYSQCTPSPSWRKDYSELQAYRYKMYLTLVFTKLRYYPQKTLKGLISLLTGRFETKMEMSLYKKFKLYLIRYVPRILQILNAKEKIK